MKNYITEIPADLLMQRVHDDMEIFCAIFNMPFLKALAIFEGSQLVVNIERSVYNAIQNIALNYGEELKSNCFFSLFNNLSMTEEYKTSLSLRQKELLSLASQTTIEKSKSILQLNGLNSCNIANILSEILKRNKNVIIGESHGDVSPYILILKNIELLKSIGAVIVLENFCLEGQSEIDLCVTAKKYSPLFRAITPVLDHKALQEYQIELRDLKYDMVRALCENGITIIAGDNEASNSIKTLSERRLVGNYVFIQNTNHYIAQHPHLKENPKIYLIGREHMISNEDCVGVAERLQGIPLSVKDTDKASSCYTSKYDKEDNLYPFLELAINKQDSIGFIKSLSTNNLVSFTVMIKNQREKDQQSQSSSPSIA